MAVNILAWAASEVSGYVVVGLHIGVVVLLLSTQLIGAADGAIGDGNDAKDVTDAEYEEVEDK